MRQTAALRCGVTVTGSGTLPPGTSVFSSARARLLYSLFRRLNAIEPESVGRVAGEPETKSMGPQGLAVHTPPPRRFPGKSREFMGRERESRGEGEGRQMTDQRGTVADGQLGTDTQMHDGQEGQSGRQREGGEAAPRR